MAEPRVGESADFLAGGGRVERARGAKAVPHRAGALAGPHVDVSLGGVVAAARLFSK